MSPGTKKGQSHNNRDCPYGQYEDWVDRKRYRYSHFKIVISALALKGAIVWVAPRQKFIKT